jgi:uncharacterized protein (UPF0276 family)
MRNFGLPALGAGAGLRHQHFAEIIEKRPPFHWFEIISEDFVNVGGYTRESFREIAKYYRIIPHGVGLSIGSTDPIDRSFLKDLRTFLDDLQAPWYSDHLCFTMVDHANLENLIPLPFTAEAVDNIIERVKIVQSELERPFLLENVTRYVTISDREMPEEEFITRILEGANCGLLLDVTNVFLNSHFHGYDALKFIKSLPLERVGQMHLAGWTDNDGHFIDSHDAPVPPEVWALYQQTIRLTGPTSVLIEWDKDIPPVQRLLQETVIANELMQREAGLGMLAA